MIKLMLVMMKIILIILEVHVNGPTFLSSASTVLPDIQRDNKGINYICRCCELRIVKKWGETNGGSFVLLKSFFNVFLRTKKKP
jgi:hypothetical protein